MGFSSMFVGDLSITDNLAGGGSGSSVGDVDNVTRTI